jgi:hypothetical protein
MNDSLFSVELRADGIVYVRIKTKEEIDIETAKLIIARIGIACNGIKRPVLIASDHFAAPTNDARSYMAEASSNPFSSASAYIARSLPEKLIANGYIRFNKPARPTRMFTSETKALEWLRSFIQNR